MRDTFLPFHVPDIGDAEVSSVVETLRSGWLTTGPKAKRFEAEFARYLNVPHAVAVNSGTAALHLALDAIGLQAGDEVIVPTMTFAATAEVVLYFKAKPVLVDCRPDTLNLDPGQIERALTSRTKAVMPVHFAGHPCDMQPILSLAGTFGLKVVEDAAHAFPAFYHGRAVGTLGDVTCFSFYATKTITTGEGGMATTSNAEWAERMRIRSLHGISKDAWKRYTREGSWYYEILAPGYKYNLTDIAAAIGLEQLRKCDGMWEARRRIAARYDAAFADLPEIRTPVVLPEVRPAWHLYVIQIAPERLRISRNEFIEALTAENIGTSVHFTPLHVHPYYRDAFGYRREDFPRASAVYDRILSLPLYPAMTEADVQDVIDSVRGVVERNRR